MEIPPDVICAGSRSILVDPVTTPDGQTYSFEVAMAFLQKNTNFLGEQASALYPNNAAKQRVEIVRDQLMDYWTLDKLQLNTPKQLSDLASQLCDETITNRILDIPNINQHEFISNTIKACKRKNNIKVLYKIT